MKVRLLVIGYGNELRGDDGVGPAVARTVASWGIPEVQGIAAHQLTPELALVVTAADRVVFVDARLNASGMEMTPLRAEEGPASLDHTSDPGWLLRLTEMLYERRPPAWLLTVPAVRVDFGEQLSPTAVRGMSAALEWVEALLEDR
jgi:hydrogenase maturation protease